LQSYSDLYQVEEFNSRLLKNQNYKSLKKNKMGNLLYTIAVILVIFWAIGFFAFSLGSIIHVLLVIAVIAILFRLIQGRGI
jgi:hypothetical protein